MYSVFFVVLVVCSSTQGFRIIRQAEVGTTTGLPGVSGSTILSSGSTGVSVGSIEVTGVATGVTGVPDVSVGRTGFSGQPLDMIENLEQTAQNMAKSIESLQNLLNGQIQDLIVEQALREQISVLAQDLYSVNMLLISLGGSPVSAPTVPNLTGMSPVSGSSSFSSAYPVSEDSVSSISGSSSLESSLPTAVPVINM